MTSAADAIEQVRRGPKGPQVGAFFDLDGTLVRGYTAAVFYSDRVRGGQVSSGEFLRILLSALDTGLGGDPTKFADAAFMGLRGRTEDTLTELGGGSSCRRCPERCVPRPAIWCVRIAEWDTPWRSLRRRACTRSNR